MSTATGWTHMNASLELPRKSTWYQMLKGDSNERCKQRTGVGFNRTSRETCRNKFKKEESKLSVGSRREVNLRELADHGRQASAATPSASPGPGQGRSIAFQLRPASPDLKRPRLLAA